MYITINDSDKQFGVRAGAIIFNHNRTKILVHRLGYNSFYMFPGCKVSIAENSMSAIKRELENTIGINEEITLKYISENMTELPDVLYHEIGFYYITTIDEKKYDYFDYEAHNTLNVLNDGKSKYRWIDLTNINEFNIIPKEVASSLIKMSDDKLEHIYQ